MPKDIYDFFEKNIAGKKFESAYIVLVNLISIPLMFFWTILGVLLYPLTFLFLKYIFKKNRGEITRFCVWVYGRIWQLILSFFVSFKKEGLTKEIFSKPSIIVVNHRSFFDTYCMNMFPVFNICFAVRAWPFRIILYKQFMRWAEYLNIESTSIDKVRDLSENLIKNGNSLLFFPEGHRSKDCKLTRFYSGAFKLAVELDVPIIPICLTGTGKLFPPGRLWLKPSRIVMNGLEPIDPKQFHGEMAHIELKRYTKNLIEKKLQEMEDIDLKL